MRKYLVFSIALFLLLTSFVKADLKDGLVLYLPFDEGKGDVTADLSGNHHDGKIEGAEWVEGKLGKALSFNGKDSFVKVPFSEDFIITDAITLGAWVRANVPFDPIWREVINACNSLYGPYLLTTGAGSLEEFGLTLSGSWNWLQSNKPLEPVFHHIVGTYDGDKMHVYFDGELDDGEGDLPSEGGEIDEPPEEGIFIGHDYAGELDGPNWWDGIIDEVVIYNRALSEDEVAELYATPLSEVMNVRQEATLVTTWAKLKAY